MLWQYPVPPRPDQSFLMNDMPFLDAYVMQKPAPEIVAGNSQRKWMDNTNQRYAYRCLPLTMANTTGWEILCPYDIDLVWNLSLIHI